MLLVEMCLLVHFNSACEIFHLLFQPFFQQVVADGSVSSIVLKNLMSSTEYQIAVFAVSAHTASEGLRGTETTCVYLILLYFPHLQARFGGLFLNGADRGGQTP